MLLIGDIIVVFDQGSHPRGRVKTGDVGMKAVCGTHSKDIRRADGHALIRFGRNAQVLHSTTRKSRIGTPHLRTVSAELPRQEPQMKIPLLAP